MPALLEIPLTAFAAAVGLATASAWVERTVATRVAGLRSRRGPFLLGVAADGLKLLSKAPGRGGTRRAVAALVCLLPPAALAAALPAGAGAGGLLPSAIVAGSPGHVLLLVALSAASAHALLAQAATVSPDRRQGLVEVVATLAGAHVALVAAVASLVLVGAGDLLAALQRTPEAWPLWRHPCGAVAFVGAVAVIGRGSRTAMGGPGQLPGMVASPGVAAVLMSLSRHLLLGAVALLGALLYCGGAAAPIAAAGPWLAAAAILVAAQLVVASLADATPEGLARLAWTRLVPLALIDVGLSAILGGLPWT